MPRALQQRLRHAADALTQSFDASRHDDGFNSAESLALLHGDIGPGNLLWNPRPCLIDWEYTHLGDPADEISYTFDQNALTPAQRQAFWNGYRQGTHSRERLAHIIERTDWAWKPCYIRPLRHRAAESEKSTGNGSSLTPPKRPDSTWRGRGRSHLVIRIRGAARGCRRAWT
ncbi:phosphotransferase [Actinospica durhamensis]|uniref:Phosphotransferase n=1 Tax=Actinospica durhamensis TaxID=1508375 RepID=A0A941IPF5_9ACTN|nr:phosphotransferase [Actinospica durhamensis]